MNDLNVAFKTVCLTNQSQQIFLDIFKPLHSQIGIRFSLVMMRAVALYFHVVIVNILRRVLLASCLSYIQACIPKRRHMHLILGPSWVDRVAGAPKSIRAGGRGSRHHHKLYSPCDHRDHDSAGSESCCTAKTRAGPAGSDARADGTLLFIERRGRPRRSGDSDGPLRSGRHTGAECGTAVERLARCRWRGCRPPDRDRRAFSRRPGPPRTDSED